MNILAPAALEHGHLERAYRGRRAQEVPFETPEEKVGQIEKVFGQ